MLFALFCLFQYTLIKKMLICKKNPLYRAATVSILPFKKFSIIF